MHQSENEKPVTCHLTQLNDSLAVMLPKQFVAALALHENDKVTISINADQTLTITPNSGIPRDELKAMADHAMKKYKEALDMLAESDK